jgi:putative ABC transport system permease protein
MILWESIKLALSSIWSNKVRSLLTMLGIIIGITSVVSLMAMGEGVKRNVEKTVNDIGTNMIFVFGGNVQIKQQDVASQKNTKTSSGGMGGFGNPANLISGDILKYNDVEGIRKIDGVEAAAPISLVAGTLRKDDYISTSTVAGGESDLSKIATGFKIAQGRMFNYDDNEKNVIVIGESARSQLFGDRSDVLGEKIKLNDQDYEIIGVLAKSNSGSLLGDTFDSITIVPFSTAKKLNEGKDKILRILLKVKDGYSIKDTAKKIENDMLTRHSKEDFSVLTQEDALSMYDTILNLLTTFIAAVAAISLIVGGVGIMNIMLVSVTERTKEIGLRKAVGATDNAILLQFLIEAVMISLIAGLISIGLVNIISQIVEWKTQIHPIITTYALELSIGVCVAVGVIFGLAPAIRAAKKNPIDALRYE